MDKIIERYSNETQKIERYEYVEILETVEVKNQSFEVLHEYYKRLSDGELFEPFDNPDKNLDKDYGIYRQKNNLLNPNEIREVREKYKLSVRDFSNILGISYGNLSAIENGSMQTKYIDSLIRLVNEPRALEKLLIARKNDIPASTYEELMDRIKHASGLPLQVNKNSMRRMTKLGSNDAELAIKMRKKINYDVNRSMHKGEKSWENFTTNSSKVSSRKLTYS